MANRNFLFENYGLQEGTYRNMSDDVRSSLNSLLNNANINEQRKKALIAEIAGLAGSLPEQSEMDRLSESIIGTSNYMKAMNQYNTAVGAAISNYTNMDYEEDYNAAEAMAQREANAGMNPDILGVSGSQAGEATNYDEQATIPQGIVASAYGDVGKDVLNGAIQAATGMASLITGFVSSVLSFKDVSESIRGKQLDNDSKSFRLQADLGKDIEDNFSKLTPEKLQPYQDKYKAAHPDASDDDVLNGALSLYTEDFINNNPYYTSRQRKAALKMMDMYDFNSPAFKSAKEKYSNAYKEQLNKRKSLDYENKELDVKEKELGYRNKELDVKEKELGYRSDLADYNIKSLSILGDKRIQTESQQLDKFIAETTDEMIKLDIEHQKSIMNAEIEINRYQREKYNELLKQGIPHEEAATKAKQLAYEKGLYINEKLMQQFKKDSLDNVDKVMNGSIWDKVKGVGKGIFYKYFNPAAVTTPGVDAISSNMNPIEGAENKLNIAGKAIGLMK